MSDIVNKEKMKELMSGTSQPYLGRSMSVNEVFGIRSNTNLNTKLHF